MTTRRRTFRRPDKFFAGKFDDWREIVDDGSVSVFFGTSPGWPPYRRERSEARAGSFEVECDGTLARRYVEVDAESGAVLVQPTETQRIAAIVVKSPFVAFPELRQRLLVTEEEQPVLEAIVKVLKAIESDLDEHDTPFPTEHDDPPDVGALVAFQRHFLGLLERVQQGERLTPAERASPA